MRRSLVLLGFAMALLFVPRGATAACTEGDCADTCPDDERGAPAGCPPDCGQCACCPHPAPLPPLTVLPLRVPVVVDVSLEPLVATPGSTDPQEIFHVPRPAVPFAHADNR